MSKMYFPMPFLIISNDKQMYTSVLLTFQTSPTMKLLLAAIVLVLLVEANAQWYKFPAQAARGQPLALCGIYRCELNHNCIFLY